MHCNVGTVLEDLRQHRRGDRVVDDQRETLRVRGVGPGLDVDDVEARVADRLREDQTGLVVRQLGNLLRRVGIDEANLDAVLRQGVCEQVVGSTVERRDADDVVAGAGNVEHCVRDSGLTRGGGAGSNATLKCGDALLEHIPRRVHDAGVDVARHGEREQVGSVLGVVELVTGRLVDRNGHGLRRGIRALACVEGQCCGVVLAHRDELLACRRRVPGGRSAVGSVDRRRRGFVRDDGSPSSAFPSGLTGIALDEAPVGQSSRLLPRQKARSLGGS